MASSSTSSPMIAEEEKKDELLEFIHRFIESLTTFSDRLPFSLDRQKLRSITTLAALAVAIVLAWKLFRPPSGHQRRQRKRSGPHAARSDRSHEEIMMQASEVSSSSGDLRVHDAVDEMFSPIKLTVGQLVRRKFSEGRKVTCRLVGVILEETSSEELQKHATVKSSVLEVLLEIAKFCDLYLMERILDDESGERVLSAMNDAGVFRAGGLIRDKVLFCSTENGRSSFVRQLEPDWHIDTDSDIIFQLSRFIKHQLHITPNTSGWTASNIFSSPSLEHFVETLQIKG